MSVAVCCKSQQRISEGLRGELTVQLRAAVLAQRIRKFQRVQLDVRITVGETLDQRRNGLSWARGRCGDPIAYVQNERPVFVYEVVGGCFDCGRSMLARMFVCCLPSEIEHTNSLLHRVLLSAKHIVSGQQ
jgi:hypothetical protein